MKTFMGISKCRNGSGGSGIVGMSAYFFTFAMSLSTYTSFVSLWQSRELGQGPQLIGLLSAASAMAAFLAQPALSLLADRSRSKNALLRGLLLAQTVLALGHLLVRHWAAVGAVMALYTAAQGAALALSNAIILDSLRAKGAVERFGTVRLSYSWGFALSAALAGWLAGWGIGWVFVLCAAVSLAAIPAGRGMPAVAGAQKVTRRRMGLKELLKYRQFWFYVGFSLCLHTTHSLSVAFLPLYFADLHAPSWVYGLGIFAMAAAETPFLLFSGKLMKRWSVGKLLLLPGCVFVLRWALTALCTNWAQLLPLYVLHGGGIIVVYFAMARYVSDQLPQELSTTGQAVVNSAVVSMSRVIGALLGGVLSGSIGMRNTLWCMAGLCAAATAALVISLARKRGGAEELPAKDSSVRAKKEPLY